jgi:hypothetical protein
MSNSRIRWHTWLDDLQFELKKPGARTLKDYTIPKSTGGWLDRLYWIPEEFPPLLRFLFPERHRKGG